MPISSQALDQLAWWSFHFYVSSVNLLWASKKNFILRQLNACHFSTSPPFRVLLWWDKMDSSFIRTTVLEWFLETKLTEVKGRSWENLNSVGMVCIHIIRTIGFASQQLAKGLYLHNHVSRLTFTFFTDCSMAGTEWGITTKMTTLLILMMEAYSTDSCKCIFSTHNGTQTSSRVGALHLICCLATSRTGAQAWNMALWRYFRTKRKGKDILSKDPCSARTRDSYDSHCMCYICNTDIPFLMWWQQCRFFCYCRISYGALAPFISKLKRYILSTF